MNKALRLMLAFVLAAMALSVAVAPFAAGAALDPPTEVWVDDDFNSSTPGWGVTHFNKIQDGVNAVASGGTVHVAAGTYNENVVLPGSKDLTLLGAQHDVPPGCDGSRGAESVLDGGAYASGSYGIAFPADPGTVVINGFTIKNYEYGIWGRASGTHVTGATIICNILENNGDPAIPGGGTNDGFWHDDGGALRISNMDNSTIAYNLVRNGERGIRLEPAGSDTSDGNVIAHNCVHDNQQYGIAIYNGGNNNSIEYNTVYNNADRGIQLTWWSSTGNKVNYNTVYNNCNDGILLQAASNAEIKHNVVYHNAFTDQTLSGPYTDNGGPNSGYGYQPVHGGIVVSYAGASASSVVVSENEVYDNGVLPAGEWPEWTGERQNTDAVGVYVGSAAVATVNYNQIYGNQAEGVRNLNTGNTLDAEYNYWGAVNGPGPVGPGSGDEVSNYVDYEPWCGDEDLTTVGWKSTTTALYLEPPFASIPNDNSTTQTFTVRIANVADLYGYQFVITFDKDNLECTAAAFDGSFFPTEAGKSYAAGGWNATIDNTNGKVYFGRTLLYPEASLTGSGPLATVTFRSKSGAVPGSYKIDFAQNKLADIDANLLPHTTGYASLTLTPYGFGTLQGSVDLQGRTDESGGKVTIRRATDGEYSMDITNTDGTWSFTNIPAGEYQVTIEMGRYLDAQKAGVVVSAGGTTTLSKVRLLGGDANDDDEVDIIDGAIIGGQFGLTPPTDPRADINNDGTVDILDLVLFGGNYMKTSPVAWP